MDYGFEKMRYIHVPTLASGKGLGERWEECVNNLWIFVASRILKTLERALAYSV